MGLEVNAGKTKYILMSRDQNAGRGQNIKTDNSTFEGMDSSSIWERAILTNQNSIQEEIKSSWKSRNACYHWVLNLLYSSLLSKNTKINDYRTIVLPVVLYGCETRLVTLREERSKGV
jgi:hypothetical protein